MYKITPFFLSTLFTILPITNMEYTFDLKTLPDPAAIIVVAACANKNALRQTCKRFCEFASRRKNENILVQPQLHLNQEALDRYLLYYGALGNTAIVRNLLARGANPNVCEDNDVKLIHHALQCGYREILDMLLAHPDLVTIDIMSCEDLIPLQNKDYGTIKHMLAHCTMNDEEVLFYAVKNGLYTLVQEVLARDVNVNSMNKKGEYPLYLAIQRGYINIMKLLITKGADIKGTINSSNTIDNPLFEAVKKGYTTALQLLIDYGIDVNIKNQLAYNYTALHSACGYGYTQMVKIVLAKDASMVNKKDNFGNTPLHFADKSNNIKIEIIKTLLEYGAHTYEKNNHGETPLKWSREWDNRDFQEALVAHDEKKRTKQKEKCVVQ